MRHFREKEIVQDRAKAKLFNPYKKDTDPYETTAQSNPHKQISEEEIQENIKKMKKKSNLKDFDSTQKDNSISVLGLKKLGNDPTKSGS